MALHPEGADPAAAAAVAADTERRASVDSPGRFDADALIEEALELAIGRAADAPAPPRLGAALRHAVFPGGARVRPQLCVAVAQACGADGDDAAGAAAAVELLHCASLVHDDLPCFDDAGERRGRPTVHRLYGEALAVLAGDGLIVAAFDAAARAYARNARILAPVLQILAESAGAPRGLVAGQAWESERDIDLRAYHRAKTGALFVAAAEAGAAVAGRSPRQWRAVGARLGEAYQIADDLRDRLMDSDALGKPAAQDARHDRPNAVAALGVEGAVDQLGALIADAAEAIPDCAGADALRALVQAQARRLAPPGVAPRLA